MKRWKRSLVVVGLVVAVAVLWAAVRRILPSSIEYRGEKIKLTKFYLDYDDYKNDPDNIAPSETQRVQRLVSEAPIARSFPGRKQATAADFQIKFPGYGLGGLGPLHTDEGALNGFEVEIPRAGTSRLFIFQNVAGSYKLLDDFIDTSSSGVREFHLEGPNLVYTTADGHTFARPILSP